MAPLHKQNIYPFVRVSAVRDQLSSVARAGDVVMSDVVILRNHHGSDWMDGEADGLSSLES